MKVIATFPDLAAAELAKSVLVSRGIPAWIPDSNLAAIDWRLGTAIGGIRLQVQEENEDAARELLEAGLSDGQESGRGEYSEDEICPHCQSTHIGPDDFRRLKAFTLLVSPAVLFTVPKIMLTPPRVKCRNCGKTWRE